MTPPFDLIGLGVFLCGSLSSNPACWTSLVLWNDAIFHKTYGPILGCSLLILPWYHSDCCFLPFGSRNLQLTIFELPTTLSPAYLSAYKDRAPESCVHIRYCAAIRFRTISSQLRSDCMGFCKVQLSSLQRYHARLINYLCVFLRETCSAWVLWWEPRFKPGDIT